MTEEHIRAFIAVELDDQVRQALSRVQTELKKTDADVKWVNTANIHVTLKFLGNIEPKEVDAVKEFFPEIFDSTAPFTLALSGLGAFPNPSRPRIIWAGLDDSEGQLKQLAVRVEEILCRLGFPKEQKEFAAHITLGRTRSSRNLSRLAQSLNVITLPSGLVQPIAQVTLFKSTLTPTGPVYDPLLTHPLKKQ